MADDKPQTASGTGVIVNRLLDAAEKEDERKEREQRLIIETLERTIALWQRTTIALIVVLLVLVSGVVGVSVSGYVPGFGKVQIAKGDIESSAADDDAPASLEGFEDIAGEVPAAAEEAPTDPDLVEPPSDPVEE